MTKEVSLMKKTSKNYVCPLLFLLFSPLVFASNIKLVSRALLSLRLVLAIGISFAATGSFVSVSAGDLIGSSKLGTGTVSAKKIANPCGKLKVNLTESAVAQSSSVVF